MNFAFSHYDELLPMHTAITSAHLINWWCAAINKPVSIMLSETSKANRKEEQTTQRGQTDFVLYVAFDEKMKSNLLRPPRVILLLLCVSHSVYAMHPVLWLILCMWITYFAFRHLTYSNYCTQWVPYYFEVISWESKGRLAGWDPLLSSRPGPPVRFLVEILCFLEFQQFLTISTNPPPPLPYTH